MEGGRKGGGDGRVLGRIKAGRERQAGQVGEKGRVGERKGRIKERSVKEAKEGGRKSDERKNIKPRQEKCEMQRMKAQRWKEEHKGYQWRYIR